MRRLALFGLFALAFAAAFACASQGETRRGFPDVPIKQTLSFKGDTAFTPEERQAIQLAAWEWQAFSSSLVEIKISWTLDFSTDAVARELGGYLLVRIPESTPWLVRQEEASGQTFYGFVQSGVLFLVPEACERDNAWREVAMHEFGHVLGLEHVEAKDAIMSAAWDGARKWTEDDLTECRRVAVCP